MWKDFEQKEMAKTASGKKKNNANRASF